MKVIFTLHIFLHMHATLPNHCSTAQWYCAIRVCRAEASAGRTKVLVSGVREASVGLDHSLSHLIIRIHTSLAERQSDHSAFWRSCEIDTEIVISWGDHSHSHRIINIHTSLAERQSGHSAFRRSREIDVEIAISWYHHSGGEH